MFIVLKSWLVSDPLFGGKVLSETNDYHYCAGDSLKIPPIRCAMETANDGLCYMLRETEYK